MQSSSVAEGAVTPTITPQWISAFVSTTPSTRDWAQDAHAPNSMAAAASSSPPAASRHIFTSLADLPVKPTSFAMASSDAAPPRPVLRRGAGRWRASGSDGCCLCVSGACCRRPDVAVWAQKVGLPSSHNCPCFPQHLPMPVSDRTVATIPQRARRASTTPTEAGASSPKFRRTNGAPRRPARAIGRRKLPEVRRHGRR